MRPYIGGSLRQATLDRILPITNEIVPHLLTLQLETITPIGGRFRNSHEGNEPSFETRVILTLALQMLKNYYVLHYVLSGVIVKPFFEFFFSHNVRTTNELLLQDGNILLNVSQSGFGEPRSSQAFILSSVVIIIFWFGFIVG